MNNESREKWRWWRAHILAWAIFVGLMVAVLWEVQRTKDMAPPTYDPDPGFMPP